MIRLMYLSGLAGGLMLVLTLVAYVVKLPVTERLLFLSMLLLLGGFVPLFIADKIRSYRRIRKIIRDSATNRKKHRQQERTASGFKGWGMNDSPFRERKAGLEWGGGNIHASKASRLTRRKFLS